MSLQVGQKYKMKTYLHNFLDTINVIAIYNNDDGSRITVVERNSGQIYHLTDEDIASSDYYILDDDLTADMTDVEDDDDDSLFDPNEIFIDFNPPPLM